MSHSKQGKGSSSRRRSLCEQSMHMVVSIARLSALSLARVSLGSPSPASPSIAKVSVSRQPVVFPSSRSQMSPVSDSARVTYLAEPAGSEKSNCVDGLATEYIRRVRARNRLDSQEAAKMLQDVLPPPPAPFILR
uniref:Uncharacterized protein n=1 Tax=Kalanchoe fedtschenkoi TaxID=63787 RepID=A0A7N0ZY12_KALFE